MTARAGAAASQVELFNLAKYPAETTNVGDQNRDKVVELQRRAEELSRESVPPLLMKEALGVSLQVSMGSTSLPEEEEKDLEMQP